MQVLLIYGFRNKRAAQKEGTGLRYSHKTVLKKVSDKGTQSPHPHLHPQGR